jgi:hypothetical protein
MEAKPKTGLAVRNFQCVMCMDTAESGIMTWEGVLDYPGHELDGKKVFKTVITPKVKGGYGKAETNYSIDDGTKDGPLFTSVTLMMNHYKLPVVTRQ